MREILFRGKTDKGEWVQGDLSQHTTGKKFIRCKNKNALCSYEVIPETVGQYTGLPDKNGKRIFEGDIVKHSIGTFVVKFLSGTFCCSLIEDDYLTDLCSIHNQCEVIGNIHDNPELLERGENNAKEKE